MTSPNPTSSEIDAFILEKVKEVVPEFEQSNDYIVDKIISDLQQMPITQDWWNFADEQIQNFTKQAMYAHTSRPIQLVDIMRVIEKKDPHFYVTCAGEIVDARLFEFDTAIRAEWNLSLDWAHQEYATKLAIYQLIK